MTITNAAITVISLSLHCGIYADENIYTFLLALLNPSGGQPDSAPSPTPRTETPSIAFIAFKGALREMQGRGKWLSGAWSLESKMLFVSLCSYDLVSWVVSS